MLIRLDSHDLSERIIRCAIEVHRTLGPGLLESVCEAALAIEFRNAGLKFKRQIGIPVLYKGELIGEHRPDFVVEEAIVVEIKRVERIDPVHIAQVITYLRMTGLHSGLILNFNVAVLRKGIRRVLY